MRGLILLGGEAPSNALVREQAARADLIAAADRGFAYAVSAGVMSHILVGDFDSLEEADVRAVRCEVVRLPREKDQTDGQAALDIAIARGCTELVLLGGFGGRFDHQFAHLCLLVRALKNGVAARMEDDTCVLWCLGPGRHEVAGQPGETLSILPLGEGLRVRETKGLFYPVRGRDMPLDEPYGISNVLTEDTAVIEIAGGLAVVTREKSVHSLEKGHI